MFALLGIAGILTSLAGSIWLVIAAVRATGVGEAAGLRRPVQTILGGAVLAMLALEAALLADDFSLEYVANHHARATPFPFNFATGWAALEGSIVLWGLILAVYTWVTFRSVSRTARNEGDRLGVAALAVMGLVAVFFFGLQATVANPFQVCVEAAANGCLDASPFPWAAAQAPPDGPGPNPLLQNHILMAIHPPMLYLGFIGLTVPFAYAISALAIKEAGVEWLRRSRRSTLVAWTFLTAGIVLGAWWAYEVLSWGGYWGWDPVENASLMPWLVATAFLHSALVQMRRGALQAWNFVLVIGAFSLTILGTFLTRSGVIGSVHSFTQSAIGPVLLGFLFLVVAGSFWLFSTRSHLVADSPRLDSLVSREGSFLLNNLLLTIFAFVVLTGTLYPLVIEAITGDRVSVGRPFFVRMIVPLAFALLLAMGVGPQTPWREADPGRVAASLRVPIQVALAAGVLTVLFASRIGYVVGAVVAGTFVIASGVSLLIGRASRAARARATGSSGSVGREIRRQLTAEPSFWAGQLSHAGVALVAIGIGFTANLAQHGEVAMEPGDRIEFAGYNLHYRSPFLLTEPNRRVQGATMEVSVDGEVVTELRPRANFYGGDTAGISTPAVHTAFTGDLYLTLLNIDATGILLRMDTSPGIWLLWVGGLIAAGGGAWSLTARRRALVTAGV
ncbi:MAG TPA: cytochrome c-type biogenesis CcmF C-terminal domain-containing protein [Acidimicrobiia bacterium]|nr:cytochrome c-type biogenesis CcmF C-terminal domain-containing protein [Acidimicrobiia bacterium]